jgi:hypothetical protein
VITSSPLLVWSVTAYDRLVRRQVTSFSISDGLAMGFISCPIIKLPGERKADIRWPMAVMAVLLSAYFIFIRTRLIIWTILLPLLIYLDAVKII